MLVVTPNTCIDVTTWLPSLVPGSVSRATRTEVTAGGKGVNVCRGCCGPSATAPASSASLPPPTPGGRSCSPPRAATSSQCCTAARPASRSSSSRMPGRVSVVNGRGPEPHEWDHGRAARHDRRAGGADPPDRRAVLRVAPTGCATHARTPTWSTVGHARGVPVFVDAAPAVLEATLPAGPDLVSPNVGEVESLLHGRTDEHVEEEGDDLVERCLAASRELHRRGAPGPSSPPVPTAPPSPPPRALGGSTP